MLFDRCQRNQLLVAVSHQVIIIIILLLLTVCYCCFFQFSNMDRRQLRRLVGEVNNVRAAVYYYSNAEYLIWALSLSLSFPPSLPQSRLLSRFPLVLWRLALVLGVWLKNSWMAVQGSSCRPQCFSASFRVRPGSWHRLYLSLFTRTFSITSPNSPLTSLWETGRWVECFVAS